MEIRRYPQQSNRSDLVIYNGLAYFSGITAREGCETLREQTKDILEQYDALLAEAGIKRENLIMANTFLADIDNGDEYGEVWHEWVGDVTPPAGICVQAKIKDGKKIILSMIAAVD